MKLTLRELRTLIFAELLDEAFDVGTMANRGLGSRGIVTVDVQGGEYLIAISTKEMVPYSIAYDAMLPRVMGSVAGQSKGDAWQLRTLYADDPVTAVMLLGAALEKWQRVVPDSSVSPSAQAIIKRYFDTFRDDPSRIENPDLGFLGATYLGPVGFNFSNAVLSGDQAVKAAVDPATPPVKEAGRVRAWLQIVAKKGFEAAYNDTKRTKMA